MYLGVELNAALFDKYVYFWRTYQISLKWLFCLLKAGTLVKWAVVLGMAVSEYLLGVCSRAMPGPGLPGPCPGWVITAFGSWLCQAHHSPCGCCFSTWR